jgi:hypothetical protein
MPTDSVAGSKFQLDVNVGSDAAPIWTRVKGITNIDPNPSETKVDTTNHDSPGWDQNRTVSRGKVYQITAQYYVDPISGVRDPGQLAVEASADTIAGDTLHIRQYRIVKAWGGQITFKSTAAVKSGGGPSKGIAPWEATLELTEKPTET